MPIYRARQLRIIILMVVGTPMGEEDVCAVGCQGAADRGTNADVAAGAGDYGYASMQVACTLSVSDESVVCL